VGLGAQGHTLETGKSGWFKHRQPTKMSCIPVGAALAVALGLGALLTLVSGQATVQCFSQFERSEFPYW
jgi:hypothetical protein